ncbi:MAG: hypothetical protein BalsKO_10160 [Balneolaceae bacterium]
MIRDALLYDATAITNIYNYYVEYSYATMQYEKSAPSYFVEKIRTVKNEDHFWLVAEVEREIIDMPTHQMEAPRRL